MATIVYGNTDLPMCGLDPDPQLSFPFLPKDERVPWTKEYVIVSSWEKNSYRSHWIRWELYQRAKPEADKLMAEYWKGGRWGKRSFPLCRYQKYICEAIAAIINSNVEGLRCSVEYPEFEKELTEGVAPRGHLRHFHMER